MKKCLWVRLVIKIICETILIILDHRSTRHLVCIALRSTENRSGSFRQPIFKSSKMVGNRAPAAPTSAHLLDGCSVACVEQPFILFSLSMPSCHFLSVSRFSLLPPRQSIIITFFPWAGLKARKQLILAEGSPLITVSYLSTIREMIQSLKYILGAFELQRSILRTILLHSRLKNLAALLSMQGNEKM